MIKEDIKTGEDLLSAVNEALHRRGVINSMKAKVRAEVFHALDDKTVPLPRPPKDVYLVSELIRDFLTCMKLDSSLSVLNEEIGQSSDVKVDREFVGGELGFNSISCDESTPLLMLLVQHYLKEREMKETSDIRRAVDNTS